jgi:hypothetical protein
MIKDRAYWTRWEAQGPLREPPDFWRALRLCEAMYEHARSLGQFPPSDPLAGIENKIALARTLNVRSVAGTDQPRS